MKHETRSVHPVRVRPKYALDGPERAGEGGSACSCRDHVSTLVVSSHVARPWKGEQSPLQKHLRARARSRRVSAESVHTRARAGQQLLRSARLHVSGRPHVTNSPAAGSPRAPCCETSAACSPEWKKLLMRGLQPRRAYAWPVAMAATPARQRLRSRPTDCLLQIRRPSGKRRIARSTDSDRHLGKLVVL